MKLESVMRRNKIKQVAIANISKYQNPASNLTQSRMSDLLSGRNVFRDIDKKRIKSALQVLGVKDKTINAIDELKD